MGDDISMAKVRALYEDMAAMEQNIQRLTSGLLALLARVEAANSGTPLSNPVSAALESQAQIELKNYVAVAIRTLRQEGLELKKDVLNGFESEIHKRLKTSAETAFVGAANEFASELKAAVAATKLDLVAVSEKAKNSLDSVREQNWNLRVQLFAGGCGLAGLTVGLVLAHWIR